MAKTPPTPPDTPLRGHALWLAEKQAVTKRNEEAFARGRERRVAAVVRIHENQREIARRQDLHLPTQPTTD
jgi:hypothetical protein